MEKEKLAIKISVSELNTLAEAIIRHSEVILVQRDPKDVKMDERSAIVHKLWLRTSEKAGVRAGAYPNIKDHTTHEQVLTIKIKELLDTVLDSPLSDDAYQIFISNIIDRALKN